MRTIAEPLRIALAAMMAQSKELTAEERIRAAQARECTARRARIQTRLAAAQCRFPPQPTATERNPGPAA